MNTLMLPVYVYGYASLYRDCFNMIAALLGDGGYLQLVKLFVLAASTWAILLTILKRNPLLYGRWLLGYLFLWQVLFLPKVTIQIEDQTSNAVKGQPIYVVANVPLGFAIVASYTSRMGSTLTELTESVFSLPDDLKYNHSGMLLASKSMMAVNELPLPSTAFTHNLRHYMRQCVIYDVLLKRYSMQQVLSSADPWAFLKAHASRARAFEYNGNIITCNKGVLLFESHWQHSLTIGKNQLLNTLFPGLNVANNAALHAHLLTSVSSGINYLTKTSMSANALIQQQVVRNALKQGILDWKGQLINGQAGANVLAYTVAQQHKRQANLTIGEMAGHWLPLMKTIFELLLYSSVIFIVLLGVLPNGGVFLRHYVGSLCWVQLWTPLYAIINFAVSDYAKSISFSKLASIGSANHLSIAGVAALTPMQQDLVSLAGYLSMSVPFLALGLTQGMAKTLTSMAQYVGGVTQSSAMAGVGMASTGNISLGNTSFDNQNAHNTNMNHLDTSGRSISGMMSASMQGGSMMSVSADGTPVMDTRSGISHLPTSINFAQAMRQQVSRQIEHAQSQLTSKMNAYTHAESQTVRQLFQVAQYASHNQSHIKSATASVSHSQTDAFSQLNEAVHSYAKAHHVSDAKAKETLSDDYANVQLRGELNTNRTRLGKVVGTVLGVSGSLSAGAGYSKTKRDTQTHRVDDSTTESDSSSSRENTLHQIDHVIRAVKENQVRSSDETGTRQLNELQHGIEHADTQRHEVSTQAQTLDALRNTQSYLKENATSVNQNLSQNFAEWLSDQPMGGHTGAMGWRAAETLMAHDPDTMALYAQEYMRKAAKAHLPATIQFVKENDERG